MFDNHVMDLLFWYIDLHQNADVRLAFEALKVTLHSYFNCCALSVQLIHVLTLQVHKCIYFVNIIISKKTVKYVKPFLCRKAYSACCCPFP